MRVLGLGYRLMRRPAYVSCAVCDGYGRVSCDYVYNRETRCTCGQGSDVLAMHDIACDTVPCPFCPLLGERALRRT